ncbi:NAD(P)/FAD-dependent oxidoreductase [Bacillus massiliglaciei]|uniref:NAD(P)/FAD-dependent oxidoreductase n=1 Tax=Bacillus massiliglaciei TaxID=1816693 RepID=UPI000AEFCDC1|nr:FAD-binding oxidoreductase [Bacillus massiliglaciei]
MKKIIIVGAGILGASTAYQLTKKGAEVVLIDRKDPGQATDAAAGIICPWISQRRNKAWYRLARLGAAFYPQLIEELESMGETDTGYAQVGAISLHTNPDKLSAMEERARKRVSEAPEIGTISPLSPEETKSLFPPLDSEYASVLVSGAARVDGRALRDALIRAAQKKGAKLIKGHADLLFHGSQVIGIKTEGQTIEADIVIVCAGAWANKVLKPLGLDFKVSFQKAQIVHFELPGVEMSKWPVVMPPNDQYLLAFEDRLVAGSTHENIDQFDYRLTAGGLEEILHKALDTAPGLAEATFKEARIGFRPFTPGFLPVLGPLPGFSGIIVANGLGASGLTMGPFIGSQLAKLALEENIDIPLEDYDVREAIQK